MLHVDIIKLHVNMHISCIPIIPSNKLHAANKNDFFVNINDLHDRFHTPYFFLFYKRNLTLVLLQSFQNGFYVSSICSSISIDKRTNLSILRTCFNGAWSRVFFRFYFFLLFTMLLKLFLMPNQLSKIQRDHNSLLCKQRSCPVIVYIGS